MVSERQRRTYHLLCSSEPSDPFKSEKSCRLPSDNILHASDVKPSQVNFPYEELFRNTWRELLFEGSCLSNLRSHPDDRATVSISELLQPAVLAIPVLPYNHHFILGCLKFGGRGNEVQVFRLRRKILVPCTQPLLTNTR